MCRELFTEEVCSELNIIGIYSLKDEIKLKNVNEEIQEEKKDDDLRNSGFSILSNKKEISNQLRKSKFCEIQIKYGTCNRKLCNFAHSVDELVFPRCAFGENCRKKGECFFLHPTENIEDYKKRVNFFVPENIR